MTVTAAAKLPDPHEASTHNVHGIVDTAVLETKQGAQDKADTARVAATSAAGSQLQAHVLQTQVGAHNASAITFSPSGLALISSTNVQGALVQLDGHNHDSRYELKNNQVVHWFHDGNLSVGTSVRRVPFPFPAQILGVVATCNVPPSGQDLIFDVLVDEASPRSLFASVSKPRILAGARATASEYGTDAGNLKLIAQYRALYIQIIQTGNAPTYGSDLVVGIRYTTSAHQ